MGRHRSDTLNSSLSRKNDENLVLFRKNTALNDYFQVFNVWFILKAFRFILQAFRHTLQEFNFLNNDGYEFKMRK